MLPWVGSLTVYGNQEGDHLNLPVFLTRPEQASLHQVGLVLVPFQEICNNREQVYNTPFPRVYVLRDYRAKRKNAKTIQLGLIGLIIRLNIFP